MNNYIMTYKEKVLNGLCKSIDIDYYIECWHEEYDGELQLHEFLGLDTSEYSMYVNWEDEFHEYMSSITL